MPDVCDLILDDHETFRRRFGELDALRRSGDDARAALLWASIADLLEVHASSEESLFYPRLLAVGTAGEDETADAVTDHNEIRDAIRRASTETAGSPGWWDAVTAAREANSSHMAEEERGAIPDFRVRAPDGEREDIGLRWLRFETDHAGQRGIDTSDKDVARFISDHQ